MTKKSGYRFVVAAGLALFFGASSGTVLALDNDSFSRLFTSFEETSEAFIQAFTEGKWPQASVIARELERQGDELSRLADKDENPNWKYDASNLHHHSSELVEAADGKDAVESVYLIGVLLTHLGYLQSANPQWLIEHVGKQIDVLEDAIKRKDREAARNSAEIVHSSSNKIVLSSGTQRNRYIHTRWLNDIRQLNGWGDAIIGDVNGGDWQGPNEKLPKIKRAFNKWKRSFFPEGPRENKG
ncbi:MAG: hypothetical protein HQL59_11605 [Magnetococcales bacterium]|nr:hypothetical protein [Magnetococcales bacterium]